MGSIGQDRLVKLYTFSDHSQTLVFTISDAKYKTCPNNPQKNWSQSNPSKEYSVEETLSSSPTWRFRSLSFYLSPIGHSVKFHLFVLNIAIVIKNVIFSFKKKSFSVSSQYWDKMILPQIYWHKLSSIGRHYPDHLRDSWIEYLFSAID
jgi:hypothetical protein